MLALTELKWIYPKLAILPARSPDDTRIVQAGFKKIAQVWRVNET